MNAGVLALLPNAYEKHCTLPEVLALMDKNHSPWSQLMHLNIYLAVNSLFSLHN